MIVAIEGMDGSGKTTVARAIEKKLKYKYIKDPLAELFEISLEQLAIISNKIFNLDNDNIKALYLSLGDSYILNKYQNRDIVLDRHVLLNYYWNGNEDNEKIFKSNQDLFGKPYLTIILKASPEIRKQRIINRNPHDPDLFKGKMLEYGYDKLEFFVKKFNYNYIIIDTDKMSIEEVVNMCLEIIKKSQN